MKRLCSVVFLASLITSITANSFAMGIFLRPGAKANSAGGVTAATSGDVTALSSNPAALSALTGSGIMFSAYNLGLPVKAAGAINGNFTVSGLIPFIGAYQSYNDYVFALGLYAAGGASGKAVDVIMPTPIGALPVSFECKEAYVAANISASKQINKSLSAGLGIDIIHRSLQQKMSVAGSQLLDSSANGSGLEINGGLTYKIMDTLKTGIVIRSGALIRMNDAAESSIIYPVTYGVGVEYGAMNAITLLIGADMQKYSAYIINWKDMPVYHVGALYKCCEKMYFGLGVQYEASAVSPNDVPVPLFDTNKFAETIISLGTGYDFGKCQLNVLYAYGISDKIAISGTDYTFDGGTFGIDIAYKF